jgi:hypothetical protein
MPDWENSLPQTVSSGFLAGGQATALVSEAVPLVRFSIFTCPQAVSGVPSQRRQCRRRWVPAMAFAKTTWKWAKCHTGQDSTKGRVGWPDCSSESSMRCIRLSPRELAYEDSGSWIAYALRQAAQVHQDVLR